MKKAISYQLLAISFLILTTCYLLLTTNLKAQSPNCSGGSSIPRSNGLVSTPSLNGIFNTSTGSCVKDPRSAFVAFKIPTYSELKSIYYDQAKNSDTTIKEDPMTTLPSGGINLNGGKSHIYSFTGDLFITSPSDITGDQTGIIFVEKNLNIGPIESSKLTPGDKNSGVVFVVGGNVNIDKSVTQIDAVIISSGTIYTATTGSGICLKSSVLTTPLQINGSLISLNPANPIQFCRTLNNNLLKAAEVVTQQPKYLVILKDIFSKTLEKWSETAGTINLASSSNSAFDYTLTTSSPNVFRQQTENAPPNTITAKLNGTDTRNLNFVFSGLPRGVFITTRPPNSGCRPTCTIDFDISTQNAPLGTYRITITGVPGNKKTAFNLIVIRPQPPTVTTKDATRIQRNGTATLNSSIGTPNKTTTRVWYKYGISNTGKCSTLSSSTPQSNISDSVANFPLTINFPQDTTYYFCAVAANDYGTTYGNILSFQRPISPSLCATGSNEVIYNDTMSNCSGQNSFSQAGNACATGTHVCSAEEFIQISGGNLVSQDYWLNSRASGGRNCNATSSCHTDRPDDNDCVTYNPDPNGSLYLITDSKKRAYSSTCPINGTSTNIGYFGARSNPNQPGVGAMCCK